MKVVLNILAKDFAETEYDHGDDCAITRAIERAGCTGHDEGLGCYVNGEMYDSSNSNYGELVDKVMGMYASQKGWDKNPEGDGWSDYGRRVCLEPVDFEFTLMHIENEEPKVEELQDYMP